MTTTFGSVECKWALLKDHCLVNLRIHVVADCDECWSCGFAADLRFVTADADADASKRCVGRLPTEHALSLNRDLCWRRSASPFQASAIQVVSLHLSKVCPALEVDAIPRSAGDGRSRAGISLLNDEAGAGCDGRSSAAPSSC